MNIEKIKKSHSEREYRALKDRISYSSIKQFDDSYKSFYKEHILKENVERETNQSMILGSIVDCLLLSPDDFDDRYAIVNLTKPTGQIGELSENLYKITLKYIDEEGSVTREFGEIFLEAFEKCQKDGKFKGKTIESALQAFRKVEDGVSGELYYDECRKNHGKQTIDLSTISIAEKIVESLRNGEYTGDIINMKDSEGIEVHCQFPILFEIEGIPVKSLFDKVVINHNEKKIYPYDLKVSWQIDNFPYNYWKMKYFLQLGTYDTALKSYIINDRSELSDYEIVPMQFIVADSALQSIPVIYKTNTQNVLEGIHGFILSSGRKQKGVLELVKEISKHIELGIWNQSMETYENKGILELPTFEINE